jgi:trimeric autotransporter adhesin
MQGGGSANLGTPGAASAVELNYPSGLALDSSGNDLYIADAGNNRILKLVISTQTLSLVAGDAGGAAGYSGDGSSATVARLDYPSAITIDGTGNLYIADSLNFVIRMVNATGVISTIAGNTVNGDSGDGGPATSASIEQPFGIAVDPSGNLFMSELNSVVREVNTSGNISTVAGNAHLGVGYGGDGNNATVALLDEPWGLATDLSGNLLIADRINNRIRKVALGQ